MPASQSYMPMLKGKEGEYAALEELRPEARAGLLPLIEVPPIPFDHARKRDAKSLRAHLASVPDRLSQCNLSLPIYIDLKWLEAETTFDVGDNALGELLDASAEKGIATIPVISRRSSIPSLASARSHFEKTGTGFALRLTMKDFEEELDLDGEISRITGSLAVSELSSLDLIVDFEDIGTEPTRANLLARSVLSLVPRAREWRKLIIAASSFPEDLSDVTASSIQKLPRHEWRLWETLQKKPTALPRLDIIFGDYAISHPAIKNDLDPRTMRMSANIRYTCENDWLILKGKNTRQFGFDQYFELCRILVTRPEYCGRNFSWGDRYISDCAEGMKGPGNATTWRKVGVNHHITLMMEQLTNPPAASLIVPGPNR